MLSLGLLSGNCTASWPQLGRIDAGTLLCRHVECAVYLLEHGADVFAIDKHLRRNCLHYAASSNRANVLRRLLDENTQVQTEEGLQSLRHLRVHDVSGQCRFIDARAENGMTALHLAAAFAGLDTLQVKSASGRPQVVVGDL